MKKYFFFILFAVLGFIANINAQIIITPNLDLNLTSSSYDITTYPNSTIYPDNYELNMRLTVMVNTGQYGRFYVYPKKRQFNYATNTWGTWGDFTPNMVIFPNLGPSQTPSNTYSGTSKTTQYEGTKFEYKVEVKFVALDGTQKVSTTPTRTAIVQGVSVPCFTMYNVVSTTTEPSYYGPIQINSICQYAVAINGSCSKFEQGYHIRISEFNKDTWTVVSDLYNNWVSGTGEAPSYKSLNELVASNNKSFQANKLYMVGFSIGPEWKSAPVQFFRVLTTCKSSGVTDNVNTDDSSPIKTIDKVKQSPVKLFPNPAKDYLNLNVESEDKILSYSIYNNSGLKIKTQELNSKSNEEELYINDLKKGLYFIEIQTEKANYREKFVKE